MDSFIEVAFVHCMLTIYLSALCGSAAAVQPLARSRMWLYAITISGIGVLLWTKYSYIVMAITEAMFLLLWFRRTCKAYIIALCVRWLSFLTCFILYQGGFHNGLWFVPVHAPILLIWLVYGIAYFGLHNKWRDQISRMSYIYEVSIYTRDQTLRVKGYLDSGNLLSWNSVPVLFIDKRYEEYFTKQDIQLVIRNTISKTDEICCYVCEAALSGCQRQPVLVCCENRMTLPMHCEVLLNLKMMTQG